MYEDARGQGEQLSEQQWARAGGLASAAALQSTLQAGTAAQKRLLKEHKGFLISLVNKHTPQVQLFSCSGVFACQIFSGCVCKRLCFMSAPSTVRRACIRALAACAFILKLGALLWLASMLAWSLECSESLLRLYILEGCREMQVASSPRWLVNHHMSARVLG